MTMKNVVKKKTLSKALKPLFKNYLQQQYVLLSVIKSTYRNYKYFVQKYEVHELVVSVYRVPLTNNLRST